MSSVDARRLVVAAAIVDSLAAPTQLLAARRSKPERIAGKWEFPGGKAEPDETPVESLHRELREELGVTVELGDELIGPDRGAWIITDRHHMRLWLARITGGEPAPLVEHDQLQWVPLGRWSELDWLPGDVRIVEALEASLAEVPQAP